MHDEKKTKKELIAELNIVRKLITESEKPGVQHEFLSSNNDEKEKTYRIISENTHDMIAIVGLDTIYTYINPAHKQLGYKPEELIGKSGIEFIHPEDQAKLLSVLEEYLSIDNLNAFKQGFIPITRTLYYRFAAKWGEWRNIESTANIIFEKAGKPHSFIFISRDITEILRAEQELNEWVNTFDSYVLKFDLKGKMIFCNEKTFKKNKIDTSLLYKKYFPDTIIWSHSKSERAKIIECFEKAKVGISSRIECTLITNDNIIKPLIFNCHPVKDKNGILKYITAEGKTIVKEVELRKRLEEAKKNLEKQVEGRTAELASVNKKLKNEIEERKRAMEDLLKEKTLNDSLINSLPGIFCLLSNNGDFIRWNKNLENIFGYSYEDMSKININKFFDASETDNIQKTFEEIDQNNKSSTEAYAVTKKGERIPFFFSGLLTKINNKKYLVGIGLDITQIKSMEEALRNSEEKYRTILQSIKDGYFEADIKGNFTFFNDSLCRIMGYSYNELLNKNFTKVMDKPTAKKVYKIFNKKFISGEFSETLDWKIIRKDKKQRHIETVVTIMKNSMDEVIGSRGIVRDITDRKRVEAALQMSEERYRDLFEKANDIIITLDRLGTFTSVNTAFERIIGYPRWKALHLNLIDIVAPEYKEPTHDLIHNLNDERERTTHEIEIITKYGQKVNVELRVRFIYEKDVTVGIQGIARDITRRRQTEEENARLAAFPRESPNPIIASDLKGNIVYLNPATKNILNSLGIKNTEHFLPKKHSQITESCINSSRNYPQIEKTIQGKIFCWTYHPIKSINLVHLYAVDITDRKRAEEQLIHDAFHDVLTGLPNRNLFLDRLNRSFKVSKRHNNYLFAVLFLDIDRFKIINDSLGHMIGDLLLKEVSQRLERSLRPEDTVARVGGDEFTILLDDIHDVTHSTRIAKRIQKDLSHPFNLEGHEVFTSASIGIALSSTGYVKPEDILRDADTAMYRAKAMGKTRYEIFDNNMHKEAMNLLQTENDLRRAIDRLEFLLYYQPIISLKTGKICGFEALLRWVHPSKGIIYPDDFLSIAEETGLIITIDKWVLQKACKQIKEWDKVFKSHKQIYIHINISSKQFSQTNLIKQIKKTITETGVDAKNLKLEITESVIMENIQETTDMLFELQDFNIEFCIDDFGKGYSSLSYLQRFPINYLKIDKSFIMRMTMNNEDFKIVQTITTLAHNLNMEVIAEGVETDEQLRILRDMKCEFAQGYFFGKALDIKTVEKLMKEDPTW